MHLRTTDRDSGTRRRTRRDESGSALLLVPTGVLIVIILAAITIDASVGFMAERSAASIASAAANDVASLGIDVQHFRSTGDYRLADDLTRQAEAVTAVARVQAGDLFVPGSMRIEIAALDATRVEVRVSGRVERLVLSSLDPDGHDISARAVATVDLLP